MQPDKNKENFLLNEYVSVIRSIDKDQSPLWGKMNLHQMIEHMSDSFRMATEKDKQDTIHTPADKLDAFYRFMMSDKPFKENTTNPLLSAEPAPVRNEMVEDAIRELDQEVAELYLFFKDDPMKKTINPIFGNLNYAEWIHLLHKHAVHHLRQFAALSEEKQL